MTITTIMKHLLSLLLTGFCISNLWGQTPTNVESAEHDPINDRWLVSNGSSVLYTDDLGNSWNTLGNAAASYGMEVIGTTLFTIHNNDIKAYDVTTGSPLGTHSPDNVAFLNGMGSESNADGDVLVVSDFSGNKLLKIEVTDPANMSSSVLVANTGTTPNGVALKDGVATVVNWGNNADILQVDVATGEVTTLIDGTGLGNCDGVDWAGESLVVSSWTPNRVTLFSPSSQTPGTWTQETLATAFQVNNPADLSVNASGDMYAVACSGNHTVFFGVLPKPSQLVEAKLPAVEAAFCGTGLKLEADVAGTWHVQGTDATGKLLGQWQGMQTPGEAMLSWEELGLWTERAVLWQVTFEGNGARQWGTVLKRMPLRQKR